MSEDLTKKLPPTADEKLTLLVSTVQALAVRLDNLEQTVSARLYDIRPIWHKVVADIGQLQQSVGRVEDGQKEIKTSIRDLGRRFSIFNDTLVTIQADYRDIYDRVRALETGHHPPNSQT